MLDKFFKTIEKITPAKFRWILNHDGFKRYFANTGWMFFGKIFTLGITFFVGIYIARYLGPANYGLYTYVISFVGLFGFLTSFGIDNIASREMVKNHKNKDKIIGTSFYLKLFGSLLAIFSVIIVSFFITKDFFTLILIWLYSFSFVPLSFNIIEIYFQSQVLSRNVVLAQTISSVLSTILKILCIVLGKGIFWLLLVYIVEVSFYAFLLLFSFRNFGNHLKMWRFDFAVAKFLLKDSWPLMLSSVAVGVYMKIDQVMIKNMLGNEQSGIYAAAVKLSEIWYFVPVLICSSVSPAIIKALSISKELFSKRMKKLYFFMFWSSFVFALCLTMWAYPIVEAIYGLPYIKAAATIRIYAWAGITVSLGVAVGQYIIAKNLTRISFYTTIFGAVINIILNFVLIPKMGINGAAIATLISYFVANFGVVIFKKTRNQGLLMLKSIVSYK